MKQRFVKFKALVLDADSEIEVDMTIDLNLVEFFMPHSSGRTIISTLSGNQIHILMPIDLFTKIIEHEAK
jgi:hypothetical protein